LKNTIIEEVYLETQNHIESDCSLLSNENEVKEKLQKIITNRKKNIIPMHVFIKTT